MRDYPAHDLAPGTGRRTRPKGTARSSPARSPTATRCAPGWGVRWRAAGDGGGSGVVTKWGSTAKTPAIAAISVLYGSAVRSFRCSMPDTGRWSRTAVPTYSADSPANVSPHRSRLTAGTGASLVACPPWSGPRHVVETAINVPQEPPRLRGIPLNAGNGTQEFAATKAHRADDSVSESTGRTRPWRAGSSALRFRRLVARVNNFVAVWRLRGTAAASDGRRKPHTLVGIDQGRLGFAVAWQSTLSSHQTSRSTGKSPVNGLECDPDTTQVFRTARNYSAD